MRGRPREPRVDEAVLAAARDLLVEVGYRRMSLDLVARRARVSRAALYRRWPGKPHLVFDAAFCTVGPTTIPETGSLEADLLALVEALIAEFSQPAAVAAAPGLLADSVHELPTGHWPMLTHPDLLARALLALP